MDIQAIFKRFKVLFEERCEKINILDMGEDSIRYDFFSAISEILELRPSDIQLEYPIHESSFVPRANQRSKRKEKPQIDLVVLTDNFRMCFEFGLFRRNSNPRGTINKTGRTLKLVNDLVRLGLHSHFTRKKAYFVCVADSFMLNHQLDCKVYDPFPSQSYRVTQQELEVLKSAIKTDELDMRFLEKLVGMELPLEAHLIYCENVIATKLEYLTKILVWEVDTPQQAFQS